MILGAALYMQDSADTAAFCCDAFGMAIGYHAWHENGTYLHAELEKGGNSLFAVSKSSDGSIKTAMLSGHQPTMSLAINLGSDDELSHAYETLVKDQGFRTRTS